MAKETVYKGNNFAAEPITTTYLNYAGLSQFWNKIKTYVDANDDALKSAVQTKIANTDAAMRAYVESLTINGEQIASNKAEGVLGTALNITIDGTQIEAGANAGKYAGNVGEGDDAHPYKINESFKDVDDRLNAAEKTLSEGVINKVDTKDLGNAAADGKNYQMVEFSHAATGSAANGDYTVTFTVDETKLDNKLDTLDEKIVELEANAGVSGIRVVDSPADETTANNYVALTLESVKVNDKSDAEYTDPNTGLVYKKSLVTLTVDETALDAKFAEVDAAHAAEVADRKEDISKLAGTGYTVANGDTTAGAWADTVKWNNITAIDEYLKTNEANLLALGDKTAADGKKELQINGHKIVTVTDGDQVSVAGSSIDLVSGDIKHSGLNLSNTDIANKLVSEILDDHESRIDALSSATHFIGVTEENLKDGDSATEVQLVGGTGKHTLQDGDVVIVKHSPVEGDTDTSVSREFIWSNGVWYELGDTTEEAQRLTKVENWIDNSIISADDINALFTDAAARDFTFA